ncbi:PucR family transcriptional regulator [Exiguobacterium sp. SH31]|uniref:PucR family transcriptional regulator n=1 Tax=unclassified Exiguobacterium TaxID=2644629 RepID=UPI0008D3B493|nr:MULTISPECIES: helix-turn-helix domain-containing protein [unclassified Exiguobacterium]OGX78421.1 PucR family transcriptional regulator [Exiguobacterium sp. SH31]TCI51529.1 PucR family transcriptional regulator [Exiguobacterium sp. SH1S21]TCI72334.1 PucR family transcriptional regulator [Exiguobacterium sp. SH0S7]
MLTTFDRIKSIFPTVVHRSEDASGDYAWYQAHDGTVFGLPKSELNERERQLLEWSATPFLTTADPRQEKWQNRLLTDSYRIAQPFRLLSLSLHYQERESLEQFLEILHDFMPEAEIVVMTRHHVEIIEMNQLVDLSDFEDVLRAGASDCYVEAHVIFSERPLGVLGTLYHQHMTLRPFAKLPTKTYPASQLLYHYLLQDHETFATRLQLTEAAYSILDKTSVELLEALFANSLNVSHTAKALFMHRNTLNYRLDRLYELTGYDARQFYDASLLQLIVTLHKSE